MGMIESYKQRSRWGTNAIPPKNRAPSASSACYAARPALLVKCAQGLGNGNDRELRSLASIRLLVSMRLARSLTSCSRSWAIWFLTPLSLRSASFDPGLWRATSIALIVALIVLIFLVRSWRSDTKRALIRPPKLAWKLLNTCLAFRSMLTICASLHDSRLALKAGRAVGERSACRLTDRA